MWFTIHLYLVSFRLILCQTTAADNIFDNDRYYFVLRLRWPSSACKLPCHDCGRCYVDRNITKWTVHGLWPDRDDGGIEYCDPSAKFNVDELRSILPELYNGWPNLFTDEPRFSLWEHEWCKHGTCARTMSDLKTELQYFSRALSLNAKYDIHSFLTQNGIKPSDEATYGVDEVLRALPGNEKAQIYCYVDHETGTQYLVEAMICLTPNFGQIDCGGPDLREAARFDLRSLPVADSATRGDARPKTIRTSSKEAYTLSVRGSHTRGITSHLSMCSGRVTYPVIHN